jgi:hypothetical protein
MLPDHGLVGYYRRAERAESDDAFPVLLDNVHDCGCAPAPHSSPAIRSSPPSYLSCLVGIRGTVAAIAFKNLRKSPLLMLARHNASVFGGRANIAHAAR